MKYKILSLLCIIACSLQSTILSVSADDINIPSEIEKRIMRNFDKVDAELAWKSEIQKIKRYNFIIIKLKILQKKKKNLKSNEIQALQQVEFIANKRVASVKENYLVIKEAQKKSESQNQTKNDEINNDASNNAQDETHQDNETQESEEKIQKDLNNTVSINFKKEKIDIQLYPVYEGSSSIHRNIKILWEMSENFKKYLDTENDIKTKIILIDSSDQSETILKSDLSTEELKSETIEFEIPSTNASWKKHIPETYFVRFDISKSVSWENSLLLTSESFKTFLNLNGEWVSSWGGSSSNTEEGWVFIYDPANVDNESDKQISAGDSVILGSFDISGDVAVNIWRVEVWMQVESGNLESTTLSFDLLLNGVTVSSSGALDNSVVYFNDITQLEIGENTSEIAVRLHTTDSSPIVNNLYMNFIALDSIKIVESSESVDRIAISDFQSKTTSIVPDVWEISILNYDLANDDNEFDKQVLVGDWVVLGSFDVRANNEAIDVGRVEIWLEVESGNLENIAQSFDLLIDNTVVSSSGALDNNIVYFNDVTQLEIGENTSEIAVQLNTLESSELANNISIWFITLDSIDWVETGQIVESMTLNNFESRTTSIVPAIITPSVIDTFNVDDNYATIGIIEESDPLCALLEVCQDITLDSIRLEVWSIVNSGTISVLNSDDINITTWWSAVVTSWILEISLIDETPLSNLKFQTSAESTFRLARNGITYSVDGKSYTTILENTLSLWEYINSN